MQKNPCRFMKIFLPLVFCMIAFSVSGQSVPSADLNAFSKDDFKISYPSGWRVDTSGTMNSKVFFFSPSDGPDDRFSDNLNVMVQPLGGQPIDIQKYREISEQQIKAMFTDGKMEESKVVNANGREEYRLAYEFSQGIFRLKVLALSFIQNDKAYLATFTAEAPKFERYRPIAEKMLGTFMVK